MSSIQEYLNQLESLHGFLVTKEANKYIKNSIKIVKHELDIKFIKKCLNNEALPPFTKLKLATNNNQQFINNIRAQITEEELKNKITNKLRLKKQLQTIQNNLFNLTPEEWNKLNELKDLKTTKIIDIKTKTHNKKLEQLGIKVDLQVNTKFVNKNRNNIEQVEEIVNKQSIFNISNKILTPIETKVLEKGLKYGIKNKKIDKYEILTRFETLAQSLVGLETQNNNKDSSLKNIDSKTAFFKELQTMATEFIELSKTAIDNLTDAEHKALIELSKDKEIIITKADKGNAVVIQNKTDYLEKVHKLLTSTGKFKELKKDVTISREEEFIKYLRSINSSSQKGSGEISDEVYKEIMPFGSRPGIMYGLPKIHKEGAPVRPIISAIGTYTYKTAKYLNRILTEYITENDCIIKDTFDFVNRVSKLKTNTTERIVIFDVESLFTNIPTEETINIILNRVYKDYDTFYGMKRETLRRLLTYCTQEAHFKFNNKFYEQIDGVAMGSPLGPLFANIFMDEFENSHMEILKELGIQTWMRYVDDVFAVIKNDTCSLIILNYLNTQHNNIRFTIENEKQNKIPFLDTTVTRNETCFKLSLYHKPTRLP